MSESKNIQKCTKHSVVFSTKLVEILDLEGTTSIPNRVEFFMNDRRVSREDFLAAIEMARAMTAP